MDFWNTKNLYIEVDNLDVLKVLRENYLSQVKMIYIDPPYNTDNDFVYNDNFAQAKEDFEATSGLFDEDGNQVLDPMQRNTESNGRFHTDWLNMIYPRLKVARDQLAEDGVIFISIDTNEVGNLRKICNEISDSKGERDFAHDLDEAKEVVVYAKLPRSFQIPTPVGNYAPDWAIAMQKGAVKHIFFIAETKGSLQSMQLNAIENAKIDCCTQLFKEISTDNIRYHKVTCYQDLIDEMTSYK